MSRWLRRYAIIALLAVLVLSAAAPAAETELEIRQELRAGDLLYNNENIQARSSLRLAMPWF